jgi:hypothetical protein
MLALTGSDNRFSPQSRRVHRGWTFSNFELFPLRSLRLCGKFVFWVE